MTVHPFEPVYDRHSAVLILGSFPSVQSRQQQFYYGHPQNRFWRVLAAVYHCAVPETIAQKAALLLAHGLALWDVLGSCEITGSADSSIRCAGPNDLQRVFDEAPIRRILLNGKTAERYFLKFQHSCSNCEVICLPSTSPANAAWSLPKLTQAWRDPLTAG